jgi:sugar phosphate isomerase/epimerase
MKKALFTVSFAGMWGQHRLTLEQSIATAARLGYDGVEIMAKRPHLSPLDYSIEDCRRVRDLLDEHHLEVASIAAYTNFTGGADSGEVPFGEQQIAYIEALAERAAVLGGEKLVRIFSSYERADMPPFEQWKRTVTCIQECCDRAAVHGVSLGLQNHHDVGVATKAFVELVSQVDRPNLVPKIDYWSIFLRGEALGDELRRLAPAMRLTTVADYTVLPRYRYDPSLVNYREIVPPLVMAVPMGSGDMGYASFLDFLVAAGFDGWCSYEMCSPIKGGGSLENLERYAKRFLEYMRECEPGASSVALQGNGQPGRLDSPSRL